MTDRAQDRVVERASVYDGLRDGRGESERRGTILVLALAVLAVLALSGVAYVSVVTVERQEVSSNVTQRDFSSQTEAVEDYIGGLLTADLFGNKIVTANVPESVNLNPAAATPELYGIWPRFMEDNDFSDGPTVERYWGDLDSLNYADAVDDEDAGIVLNPFDFDLPAELRIARSDDAWLASSEPDWNFADLDDTAAWGQITNLRSAYVWDQNAGATAPPVVDPDDGRWVRQDGRFVDLGRMFDSSVLEVDGVGNPTLDLNRADLALGPGFGSLAVNPATGGLAIDEAFEQQVDQIDGQEGLTLADEREWVDTDGDLRADARWQQIDVLGERFGLKWVVAARIVDASGLINVNSSLESPNADQVLDDDTTTAAGDIRLDSHFVGDGRTPADIDLYRLLTYNWDDTNTLPSGGVFADGRDIDLQYMLTNTNGENAFRNHIERSLDVPSVLRSLQGLTGESFADSRLAELSTEVGGTYSTANLFDTTPTVGFRFNAHAYGDDLGVTLAQSPFRWGSRPFVTSPFRWTPLTREQRASWYSGFGSSPLSPAAPGGRAFGVDELEELRAFVGTNDARRLSPLELAFDGPEAESTVLPSAPAPFVDSPDAPLGSELGPVRSWENPLTARSFEADTPTGEALFWDNRRQLTTVSGARSIAPILIRPADVNSDGLINDGIIAGATAGFAATNPGPNEVALANELGGLEPRAKLRLEEFADVGETSRVSFDPTLARLTFDAFAWSLMPFAAGNDADLDGAIDPSVTNASNTVFPDTNVISDRSIASLLPEVDFDGDVTAANGARDVPWLQNTTPNPLLAYGGAGGSDPTGFTPLGTNLYTTGTNNSPAQWFENWVHRLPNASGNEDRIGIHYALYSALAMTANLFDASDQETVIPSDIQAGQVSSNERPTVLRFFNVLGFASEPNAAFLANQLAGPAGSYGDDVDNTGIPTTLRLPDEVVPLSRRMVFGDIPADAVNPTGGSDATWVGEPATADLDGDGGQDTISGLTVVGLDRQPFLASMHTFAVYQNRDVDSLDLDSSPSFDPALLDNQIGCVVSVELFNPWPDPIDVEGYIARITQAGAPYAINLVVSSGNVELISGPGSGSLSPTTIGAGSSRVFAWRSQSLSSADSSSSPAFSLDEIWSDGGRDSLLNQWELNLVGALPTVRTDYSRLGPGAVGFTGGSPAGGTSSVFFQGIVSTSNSSPLVVSLVSPVGVATPTTATNGYVVDRMSRDTVNSVDPEFSLSGDVGSSFPGGLHTALSIGSSGTDNIDITRNAISGDGFPMDDLRYVTVRAVVHGSMYRPSEPVSGRSDGLPSVVLERPDQNRISVVGPLTAPGSLTLRNDFDDPDEVSAHTGAVPGFVEAWAYPASALTVAPDPISVGDRATVDVPPPSTAETVDYEMFRIATRQDPALSAAGNEDGNFLADFDLDFTGNAGTTFDIPAPMAGDPDPGPVAIAGITDSRVTPIRADSTATQLEHAGVELYVPDTPLTHVADVLLVSSKSHMYVHDEAADGTANSSGNILDDDIRPSLTAAALDPTAFGPGRWLTVSEQLGFDWELYANPSEINPGAATPYVNAIPNPYVGRLHPLRDVLGVDAAVATETQITRQFALPAALRVLDMFEATRPASDRLVQGKVNINTATSRVLESLPGVAPFGEQYRLLDDGTVDPTVAARQRAPIGAADGAGGTADRIDMILGYRDRRDGSSIAPINLADLNNGESIGTIGFGNYGSPGAGTLLLSNDPFDYSGIPGHRQYFGHDLPNGYDGVEEQRRGFVSIGELQTLAKYRYWGGGTIQIPVEPRPVATDPGLDPFPTSALSPQRTFTELVDTRDGTTVTASPLADESVLPWSASAWVNVPQLPGYTPVSGVLGTGADGNAALGSVWEQRAAEYDDLNSDGMIDAVDAGIGFLDVSQGVDEHYAILRQLANVIETRSDVYIATYVLRGYDPNVIRQVRLQGDVNETLRHPLLQTPAYETRRLVVYDRSNVEVASDRPRVLLSVELPSSRP